MEKTLQCPKCGSTEIETRDHDKLLKTTGGVLMTAAGTTLFVECGPGKVLAGLVKRISDVPVVNIFDPDSIQAALGAE